MRRLLSYVFLAALCFGPLAALAEQNIGVMIITVNGQPAPKIVTMGQEAKLFRVKEGKSEATKAVCPVSHMGRVEFEMTDDEQYVVQVYLNGGLQPLYSPVLKPGVNQWDIPVAEVQLTDGDVSVYEGKTLVLYREDKGDFIDAGAASLVLTGGLAFLSLPNQTDIFHAGMEMEGGRIVFSQPLRKGRTFWNVQETSNGQRPKTVEKMNLSDGPKVLTAVWANNGEDKVIQDELRASQGKDVKNSIWDGHTIKVFGAKNEVVAFDLILESAKQDAANVRVEFDRLEGPDGFVIASRKAYRQTLFNFIDRNIELFYVRYLQIKGVGRLMYRSEYDERHVPERLRLPYTLPKGTSHGKFEDRPNANKFYPDIAVPIELHRHFTVAKGNNQSIWADIYIPKDAPAGIYKGQLIVQEGESNTFAVSVELQVLPFELPDKPNAKTMVYYSDEDINDRYFGQKWPQWSKLSLSQKKRLGEIWMNHHKLAHRHKISLIDGGTIIDPDKTVNWKEERIEGWMDVLSGDAFTKKYHYAGPGVGVSSGVYSIGTYDRWKREWNQNSKFDFWKRSDLWVNWFEKHFPNVEYFLYLHDEPPVEMYDQINQWAKWIKENPGPGKRLKTLVTRKINRASKMPAVDIFFTGWGDTAVYKPIAEKMQKEGKVYWAYNGWRPSTGSFATEDDGVALRVIGWTHYKHKVGRWFYWQSTAYKNPSYVNHETNVFESAWTFGRKGKNAKYGESGWNYANGDGVLFYPGTERRYPEENYGIDGPIASLRLKHWRRGIQDVDYLTMAAKYDKAAVDALVQKMIPRVLWEVGVTNPKDPTYVHTDISWSTDPDVWERARKQLAEIILKGEGSDVKVTAINLEKRIDDRKEKIEKEAQGKRFSLIDWLRLKWDQWRNK